MTLPGDPDVDHLCRLVAWDAAPRRDVDWAVTEEEYGRALPADFKRYSSVFPTGVHFDALTVPTPRTRSDGSGMPSDIAEVMEIIRHPRRAYKEIRDEPFGAATLLPWGFIGVDDLFCWETTDSDPDGWPVVVCTFELTDQFLYNGGMVQFLSAFADRTACPPGLEHVLPRPRDFAPIRFAGG